MKKLIIFTILFSLLIVPAELVPAKAGTRNLAFTVAHHLALSRDVVYPGYKDTIYEIAGIPVTSRSIVVMDAETGEIIYSRNPHLKTPIASLTKIMSLITFIESRADLDKVVIVKDGDLENLNQYVEEGDVIAFLPLYNGDEIRAKDAVYAGIIRSANNAVSMFVRATELSEEEFVHQMNERAWILGLRDTHFTEPTGLDPKNISTAYDMANLARYAFKNGFIKRVTTTKNYYFNTLNTNRYRRVGNTNRLLSMFQPQYYNVQGGKTGYLDESRYNLMVQVRNWQGKKVIAVVLGAETNMRRFWEAKGLIVSAFGEMD